MLPMFSRGVELAADVVERRAVEVKGLSTSLVTRHPTGDERVDAALDDCVELVVQVGVDVGAGSKWQPEHAANTGPNVEAHDQAPLRVVPPRMLTRASK
jgi:hypothetical protein